MNKEFRQKALERKMAEYNTQKEELIVREYGRNTQNLINHAKTIEDKEERQAYIEKIVDMIMSMHPHTRNLEDYRLKVWSHVLQMANHNLDVVTPTEMPDSRNRRKPDKVPYPKTIKKMRHYGKNVRTMIDKAIKMEDLEKKQAYVAIIGAYMKMSYKTWNRENVNDEVVYEEFAKMSKGEIVIHPDADIDGLVSPRKIKTGSNSSSSNNSGNNNNRRSNNRNNNSRNNSNNSNKQQSADYKKKQNPNSKKRNSNGKNQRNNNNNNNR